VTISKGHAWGRTVPRPPGLRVAADDAELAEYLADGTGRPTAVAAGDMWRTVGAAGLEGRAVLNALPLDLLEVRIDDRVLPAVAHVVAHLPWRRGGWLRGPVIVLMNAEFVGKYDVAPRGHPNDGRIESLSIDEETPLRQRLAMRSRARNASHVPHPRIATRSTRHAEFPALDGLRVVVDGRDRGLAHALSVRVRPDAAVLHA
jgi:hypothetical protein